MCERPKVPALCEAPRRARGGLSWLGICAWWRPRPDTGQRPSPLVAARGARALSLARSGHVGQEGGFRN